MKIVLSIFLILQSFAATAQEKIDPAKLLHEAELKRMPWAQMSLYAMLSDSSGKEPKVTTYHVFLDVDKALVICNGPATQKGNLLLLQKQELWYYMKATSRPMKITPLQKLSGAVSFVDITRLNWSEDFLVDSFETIKSYSGKSDAWLIHLKPLSDDVSYRKINLWIDAKSRRPLRADIYLTSGKLYKTVLFTKYETMMGKEVNTQMEFIDHFNNDRHSVITFSGLKQEKNIPQDYFIRDKMPDISKAMLN